MHPITEALQHIEEHTKYSLVFLRRMYQAEQQKEAEKVAHDWRASTAIVRDAAVTQVLGRTETRAAMAIYNKGPSDVILSNEWFDGPRAVVEAAANKYGGVFRWLYLPSGGSQAIDSQGELWAFSVNFGTGANEQAQLEVIETMYRGVRGFMNKAIHPDGAAAALLEDTPMSYEKPSDVVSIR